MDQWFIFQKKADFDKVAEKFNISPITARLIRNRDVKTDEEINDYLNGSVDDLNSPWLLKDIDRAVDIISLKIAGGDKIRIITDYDIDGICSGYILGSALDALGANWDVVVPHRIRDGYGINAALIEDAHADRVDTIITCDNGIAACDQVDRAKELGMTVIITDHHEVPFKDGPSGREYVIPRADAVINQKQPDCGYPYKELCGASVAFKLCEALYESRGMWKSEALKFLEFAAIATIGDVVPLNGENRIIVKCGMEMARSSKNVGLNALINACGLNKSELNSYHIGFVIGPCLNASGRLDTAQRAISLFFEKKSDRAAEMAGRLKELNDERKEMTESAAKLAFERALEFADDKVLVIYLPDCHESVAGIVAGRVRERFNKPTLILTKSHESVDGADSAGTDARDNGADSAGTDAGNNGAGAADGQIVKGSARSIDEYNMFEEFGKLSGYFTKFGGHKMAAGLSMMEKDIDDFRRDVNAGCPLSDDDMVRKIWLDMKLPFRVVSRELIEEMSILEPYGASNRKPLFGARNVSVERLAILGKRGNVAKLEMRDEGGTLLPAYYFGDVGGLLSFIAGKFGEDELLKAQKGRKNGIYLTVAYYPDLNTFRNETELRIVIKHFM